MLTDEALDVLALRPGATASETKEAYRDLVKVWHPDRFGNDVRLREKAEIRLRLINEAYRLLGSNSTLGRRHTAASYPGYASSGAYASHDFASPAPPTSSGRSSGVAWIFRALGISAILLGCYFAIKYNPRQVAGSSHDSAGQQSEGISVQQAPGASRIGRIVHFPDMTHAGVRSKGGLSKDPGPRHFHARSLSVAETDRLETACSGQKELWGQGVYQWCLKAQLDVITSPAVKPDLSPLREAERESIESVCSEARRRGPGNYNRCETEQVASLAAEPARPDLSTLNDADRHSIESACARAKNQDGPAAYNRCLDIFVRTLTAAR